MRVSKWGNSLAVRLPRNLVEALGLSPGDELEIIASEQGSITVRRDQSRELAVERMRNRALDFPRGYKFDREEANAR